MTRIDAVYRAASGLMNSPEHEFNCSIFATAIAEDRD